MSIKKRHLNGYRHCVARLDGTPNPIEVRSLARNTFTGSSRKARYAGTRLAISANEGQRGRDRSGSDALTPKTSVLE